jgi:hypothetical protein
MDKEEWEGQVGVADWNTVIREEGIDVYGR